MLDTKLKPAYLLTVLVLFFALIASVGGLIIDGLYRDKSIIILGWHANDLVTLVVALPILVIALILSRSGSHRAQLVWLGMLDYLLYNFAFYLFGANLNLFFLIYVALFILSVFALIFGLINIDIKAIAAKFKGTTPVKWISGYMILWGALLGIAWIGQWLTFVINGHLPPNGLEESAFKLVATLDLSLVVSGVLLAAIWLWKRKPWGYVLATIFNIKGATYTLVLITSSLYSANAGVKGAMDLVPLWIFLGVACLISSVVLLRNMQSKQKFIVLNSKKLR